MPICIVKDCRNRISRKNCRQLGETTKLTFHMCPKNGMRRQLWINSLELDEWSLPKHSMECFVHFKSEDFDRTSSSCIRYKLHKIQRKEPAKNTRKYQRKRVHLLLYIWH